MRRPFTQEELVELDKMGYDVSSYKGELAEFPDPPPTSSLAAGARATGAAAIPTLAGGVGFAAGMAGGAKLGGALGLSGGPAAPITVPALAILGGLAGGYGASKLAGKAQEAVMPEAWQMQLAKDVQEHPVATTVGGIAAMPLGGFVPNGPNVLKAVGTVGRLGAGLTTKAAERANLLNVGAGAGIGGIQEVVMAPLEGREVTPGNVALNVGLGAAFNKPWALGRKMGFTDINIPTTDNPSALTRAATPPRREPVGKVEMPYRPLSAKESAKAILAAEKKQEAVVARDSDELKNVIDKRVSDWLSTAKAPSTPVPATGLKEEVQASLKGKGITGELTPRFAEAVTDEILTERGIQVAADGSLVNSKGEPINGRAFFDKETRKILFNPFGAGLDTLPHEGVHHMRWDLEAAAEKGDKKAAALLQRWDALGAEELAAINAKRREAGLKEMDAHEFAVSQQGFEFIKQQLNLKKETPWKRWWNDTRALFNTKYNTGKVSLEDMRRAINFKFVHERVKATATPRGITEREQPGGDALQPQGESLAPREGDTPIKLKLADGTIVDAVSNGKNWEFGGKTVPNVGRAVEIKPGQFMWSDGPLRDGEQILSREQPENESVKEWASKYGDAVVGKVGDYPVVRLGKSVFIKNNSKWYEKILFARHDDGTPATIESAMKHGKTHLVDYNDDLVKYLDTVSDMPEEPRQLREQPEGESLGRKRTPEEHAAQQKERRQQQREELKQIRKASGLPLLEAGSRSQTYPEDRTPVNSGKPLTAAQASYLKNRVVPRSVSAVMKRIRNTKMDTKNLDTVEFDKAFGKNHKDITGDVYAAYVKQGNDSDGLIPTINRIANRVINEWLDAGKLSKGPSKDQKLGGEGDHTVEEVLPVQAASETQTREAIVPKVAEGMSKQQAAAAKIKALEEERELAVADYGETSEVVQEIDNEIEMWQKRAGREQGEDEGLRGSLEGVYGHWIRPDGSAITIRLGKSNHEKAAIEELQRLVKAGKLSQEEYDKLNIPLNSTSEVEGVLHKMGYLRGVRNGPDDYYVNGFRTQNPTPSQTRELKNMGIEHNINVNHTSEGKYYGDGKAIYTRNSERYQGEGESLPLNPEWRQDQVEEIEALYGGKAKQEKPVTKESAADKFKAMRAAVDREQGEGESLLQNSVLHTVRDKSEIANIVKSGLRRGSNITMDGTKENQSLGQGVTLVYDAKDVSFESKGYNPNDGLVTRQRAAKPKAILVETGDLIEQPPVTLDELNAEIERLQAKQDEFRTKAKSKEDSDKAEYLKKLEDIIVDKVGIGDKIILSTKPTTHKVKGPYDPRKGYSEEKEITIPSKQSTFSLREMNGTYFVEYKDGHSTYHRSLRDKGEFEQVAKELFASKQLGIKNPSDLPYHEAMRRGIDFNTEQKLNEAYGRLDSMLEKNVESLPGYTAEDYIKSLKLPKDIPVYRYEADEDGKITPGSLRRIDSSRLQEAGESLFQGKQGFFEAMSPTFDKLKGVDPEVGPRLAEGFARFEVAKRGYIGWRNEALKQLSKFDKEEVQRVAEMRRNAYRNEEELPPLEGEAAEINEVFQKYYHDEIGKERNDLGLLIEKREAGTHKEYMPDMLNEETIDLFVNRPATVEARYAKNQWAEYVVEQSDGEITLQEAKEHINDYVDAIGGKNDNYLSVNFGAIRKAAGYGLPDSLREMDPVKALARYGRRAASDLAMFKELESKPEIGGALKLRNPNTGELIDHPNRELGLNADKRVKNAMKWVTDDFGNTMSRSQPHVNAFVRLVNNALLGGPTGIRDLVSVGVNSLPYIQSFGDLGAALRGATQFRQHAADALRSGAKQPNLDLTVFNTLMEGPDRFIKILHKVGTGLRKWQGREYLENLSRDITFGMGKEMTLAHIEGARNGNANSQKFLEKFKTGVDGDITTLEGAALDKAVNTVAANFTERVQGTYGGRGLPVGVVESQFAPFMSLQKWGIEKANVVFQDVFKPALTGENYLPLLTYSLGSVLTGAAIQELNKVLTGRKPQDPNIKEALDKGDAKAYVTELATLMQLGSFAGIVGDVMKAATDTTVRGKTTRNVVSFPAYTAVADTGEKVTDAAEAIRQGENPWDVIKMLSLDLITQNIQNARAAANYTLREKDIERSDKFRDRRTFNELEGKPAGEIPRPNRYLGIDERKFKQASTAQEVRELMPKVLQRAKEKAQGNPEKFRRAIASLKGNSYQTMPSPEESPLEFRAYYQYLVRTQGQQEADSRLKDYLTQRLLNRQKSALLPSVR